MNVKQSQHDRSPRRFAPRNDMIATFYKQIENRSARAMQVQAQTELQVIFLEAF